MFGLRIVHESQVDKLIKDVSDDVIEACARIAETNINCGCGRSDCYSDNIPKAIAAQIRELK